ncbi:MAG: xanthine dehydrogenase family protein subunit M [Spirochaetaceae bacterium]|nr:MAG: xanthine dehydrogenase family protein subunit M [Spirochaetaceae bacterium]
MKRFSFAAPASVDDAVRLLAEHEDARLMAGGVDLVHEMKRGIRSPSLLVHIAGLPQLEGITLNDGRLEIGALTKIAALESDELVIEHAPLLAAAAREVATPQLRAMGTIAGNILQRPQCWYYRDPDSFCLRKGGEHCHAVAGDNRYHAILGGGPCHIVCPSDLAPALLALGASAVVSTAGGSERRVPLSELFVGPRVDPHNEHALSHGEIITRLDLPSSAGLPNAFLKARERTAWDFALSSVSALCETGPDGVVRRARIVLGGVAPNAWDAAEAAESLVGRPLGDDAIDAAAAASVRGARPLRDNAYKVELTRRLVKKALESLRGD